MKLRKVGRKSLIRFDAVAEEVGADVGPRRDPKEGGWSLGLSERRQLCCAHYRANCFAPPC